MQARAGQGPVDAVALPARGGDRYSLQPQGTDSGQNTMNAPSTMDSEDVLRIKLGVLRTEHRDLDEAIHLMEASGRADQLALRRLKKQKLGLKDRIARIEDVLTPDIIA